MKGACSETYVTSLGLLQSSVQLQQNVQMQLQSRKVLASRLARIEVNAPDARNDVDTVILH